MPPELYRASNAGCIHKAAGLRLLECAILPRNDFSRIQYIIRVKGNLHTFYQIYLC